MIIDTLGIDHVMRVLLPAEYKEQLAVAEKLYEVQAPLRAAQAEEDARLQQLEAEEEQRNTPNRNPCHVTVMLWVRSMWSHDHGVPCRRRFRGIGQG